MTTSTPTIPARTVREINIEIGAASALLDRLDAKINGLRDLREEDAIIDDELTFACNWHTALCGTFADLHAERAEAQDYERHLDDAAEEERVLAEYRRDQRL